MNTKITILTIATAAATLVACSKSESNSQVTSPYITISTGIGTMSKLSTADDGSQTFTAGDKISVYSWVGDAQLPPAASQRVVDNAINTLGADGKWSATPQMLWKNLTDKHYFVGIYPMTDAGVQDLTQVSHTIDVSKQGESDILVANELTGKIAQNTPVPLTFDHMMAKVTIELAFRDQWSEEFKDNGGIPDVDKVTVENVSNEVIINCITKTVTAKDSRATVTVPQIEENRKYSTVIAPQSGVKVITVTIKGKNYTYTHGEDIKFESGKITSIKLTVGRNQIVSGDVTINNWIAGETIDSGEALDAQRLIRVIPSIATETKGDQTRAALQSFDLFINNHNNPKYSYTNTTFTKDANGKWNSEITMLWENPAGTDQNSDILAISPALKSKGHSISDDPIAVLEIEQHQSLDSSDSDYLFYYSHKDDYRDTNFSGQGEYRIYFTHLMTKICFEFSLGTEFNHNGIPSESPIKDIRIDNIPLKAEVKMLYGKYFTVTADQSSTASIYPYEAQWLPATSKDERCKAIYECIIIPESDIDLSFTLDGIPYSWSKKGNELYLGAKYTIQLTIGKDEIKTKSLSCVPWIDGGENTIETE